MPELETAKTSNRLIDYWQYQRELYKTRSKTKAKTYNNQCRGYIRNDTGYIVKCNRKTGKNRFFCPICHSRVKDYGMEGL